MTIAQREEAILRIKRASSYSQLNEQLEQRLRTEVVTTVQAILEESLNAELDAHLSKLEGKTPRRSGYNRRSLSTQYGHISDLRVPKLRYGNKDRVWRILERYARCQTGLLDYAGQLYVMGLSLRDLQEALYLLMGQVLSRTAVNQVTLRVEERMSQLRRTPIEQTPVILIVDGVWVEIQYPQDGFKIDRAGHRRQHRQAEDRVILTAIGVFPDGSHRVLHYKVSQLEDEETWTAFFQEMLARQLDPQAIRLVVSDGTKGMLGALARCFPHATQQRCITHKVRGMEPKLTYAQLPDTNDEGQTLNREEAKRLRRFQIKQDAYAIYEAPTYSEAQGRLKAFNEKWETIEPDAVHTFNWGIKRTFEYYQFDPSLHPSIRTTNLLERFFREFRTKSDEIGAFPNETSCLILFFLVMQREHAKHDRLPLAINS